MDEPADLEKEKRESAHARSTSRTLLAVLVGGALGVALVLGGTIWWHRLHALPQVTQEEYSAARVRWEQQGPASYNLRVELSGNVNDVFDVEVRLGEVERFLYNGAPLNNPRTEQVWTVPGMFSTIAEDLARCARQEKAAADPESRGDGLPEPTLIVRARFEETYGYPAEYLRIELGGQTDVSWEVTKFEVVEVERPGE